MVISLLLMIVLAGFAVLAAGASVFSVLLLMMGVGLLALGLWMRAMRRRCAAWVPVTGVVLESRVDSDDPESARPLVRYRYEVNGETYECSRIAYAGHAVGMAAMQALIAPYVEGKPVTVYHDPVHPALAVLDREIKADWHFWAGMGLFFVLLGLALPVFI